MPAPAPEITDSLEQLAARWRLAGGGEVSACLTYVGPLWGHTEEARSLKWSGVSATTPEHALEMAAALREAVGWLRAVRAPGAVCGGGEGEVG